MEGDGKGEDKALFQITQGGSSSMITREAKKSPKVILLPCYKGFSHHHIGDAHLPNALE